MQVYLRKIEESENDITYSFGSFAQHDGILKLDKSTGKSDLIKNFSLERNDNTFFNIAKGCLYVQWKSGIKEYPETFNFCPGW